MQCNLDSVGIQSMKPIVVCLGSVHSRNSSSSTEVVEKFSIINILFDFFPFFFVWQENLNKFTCFILFVYLMMHFIFSLFPFLFFFFCSNATLYALLNVFATFRKTTFFLAFL